ncbi:MAG: BMP family ABC transporter substrate-binding protein [Chloroflexota bacterium]|jgi:hypothetical protein
MRSTPLARIIAAAAALTLLMSSAVSAQINTRFPEERGPELLSSVVTSALDDSTTNGLIEKTVRDYHQLMKGRTRAPADPDAEANNRRNRNTTKEQPRGGWLPIRAVDDTERVTETVFDVTAKYRPDVMVVSGGDGQANVSIAKSNSNSSVIIDLSQPRPCVTESGQADASGQCSGGVAAIPPNYSAVEFAVEDGAYLAGVLAAKASRGGRLGVISGYAGCVECERYVEGFVNGARSINPEIDIEVSYLATDENSAFSDPASARTFAEIFIDVYQPTVLLPIGRGTSTAMIEAACEAGIKVIGTGYDVLASRPDLDRCLMLSITKDMTRAIEEALYGFSFGETERVKTYDLANGGVGITEDWPDQVSWYPVDTNDVYRAAEEGIRSGTIEACPDGCGVARPSIDSGD